MSAAVVWHDVECGGYTADLPLWRELAARGAPGRCSTSAPAPAASRCTSRAPGTRSPRSTSTASCWPSCERAGGDAGVDVETVVADAARLRPPRRFALVAVPMQTIQLLPARAGRLLRLRAPRACVPGGLVALAIADELETFDGAGALPPPDVGVARRAALRLPADRRPRGPGRRRGSSACATRSGPTARRSTAHDVIELAAVERRASSRPRARPPGCSPSPPHDRADAPSTSAPRW